MYGHKIQHIKFNGIIMNFLSIIFLIIFNFYNHSIPIEKRMKFISSFIWIFTLVFFRCHQMIRVITLDNECEQIKLNENHKIIIESPFNVHTTNQRFHFYQNIYKMTITINFILWKISTFQIQTEQTIKIEWKFTRK